MKLPFATVFAVGWLRAGIPADVSAPSVEDVHKLYGEPTMERFAVGNGITVTVEYGPDRAACQILSAPRRLLVEVKSPDSPMSSLVVPHVLQELLRPATRGKQVDSNSVQVDGNTLVKTDYEKFVHSANLLLPILYFFHRKSGFAHLSCLKRDVCPRDVQ